MNELEILSKEYYELLNQQQFVEHELDYSILEKLKPTLSKLSDLSNSGITVFDLHKKEHVFTSYNFSKILGYDLTEINKGGNDYFNSRVHPEDLLILMKFGINILKFFYSMPVEIRPDYKFVNEYRVKGSKNTYVRVIEQHQSLELDNYGNVWLALSVIDISPNQTELKQVMSQLYNIKTGELVNSLNPTDNAISKREKEVLTLIKEGLLSREISDKLSISIHTVNTHRQRILEKLKVHNSIEAVNLATKMGLLELD
jgi:DNA-binding CsgD family transcriptional regulator